MVQWIGDYAGADMIHAWIDKTQVVVPWDCICSEVGDNMEDLHTFLDKQRQTDGGMRCRVLHVDVPRS